MTTSLVAYSRRSLSYSLRSPEFDVKVSVGPDLQVSIACGLFLHACLLPTVSVSNLSFLLKKSPTMTTLDLGLTRDPKGSYFKNLNLIISAKSLASPKVPCTGSGNMWFRDTAQPSVWCSHHALLCNGPILQVSTQNHQQCPGSHDALGLSRVFVAIGWL